MFCLLISCVDLFSGGRCSVSSALSRDGRERESSRRGAFAVSARRAFVLLPALAGQLVQLSQSLGRHVGSQRRATASLHRQNHQLDRSAERANRANGSASLFFSLLFFLLICVSSDDGWTRARSERAFGRLRDAGERREEKFVSVFFFKKKWFDKGTTVVDPFHVVLEARFFGPSTWFRRLFYSKIVVHAYHNQTFQDVNDKCQNAS